MTVVMGGLGSSFFMLPVGGPSTVGGNASIYTYPFPLPGGVQVSYKNEVWDAVAGNFVTWATFNPDPSGAQYPGPGAFGVTTSDYAVQPVTAIRNPEWV